MRKGCGIVPPLVQSSAVLPAPDPANGDPAKKDGDLAVTYDKIPQSKHMFTVAEIQGLTSAYLMERNCPNSTGVVDRAIIALAKKNKDFTNFDFQQAKAIAESAAAIT